MRPRRFAATLVPAGAYWRDPLATEQKIDFGALEEAEGEAIHGSRLRLGLLLHAQREALIRWTRSPRFNASSARRMPLWFSAQIGNEFIRIRARGYYEGVAQHNAEAERAGGKASVPGLSEASTTRLIENAWTAGRQFAAYVLAPVRVIVQSAFGVDGRRIKPQERLEQEIRSAYARWIMGASFPVDRSEIHLATPLDVMRIAYQTWQQRNLPIVAWLDYMVEEMTGNGTAVPILTDNATKSVVLTERMRQVNAARYESGLKDVQVEAYQFSAMMDERTCAVCRRLDGIIRPKRDEFWYSATPPMHDKCRCVLSQVMTWEKATPTEDAIIRELNFEKVPVGYGGYDPSLSSEEAVSAYLAVLSRRLDRAADTRWLALEVAHV